MGKTPEAISSLVSLLEFNPTDAESWAELSDLYLSQGLYSQAIYALEETIVLAPNAWNVCYPFPLHGRPHLTLLYSCTQSWVR